MAAPTLPEIPATDGAVLAAHEAELEGMMRRIVEIGNLADRAAITDLALAAERAVQRFQSDFVDFMASRLSPGETSVWENLRHG